MTTVVAVETPKGVTFASDSRITTGWQVNDGWLDKVVKNGSITFAAAGYLRTIQILAYAKLPEPPTSSKEAVLDRFVALELVPAVVNAFKDTSEGDALRGSQVLVSFRGRVYSIGGDGSWLRSKNGHYAVGSGAEYALGALAAGSTPKESVVIASQYDNGTNSDVRKLTIKNKK